MHFVIFRPGAAAPSFAWEHTVEHHTSVFTEPEIQVHFNTNFYYAPIPLRATYIPSEYYYYKTLEHQGQSPCSHRGLFKNEWNCWNVVSSSFALAKDPLYVT